VRLILDSFHEIDLSYRAERDQHKWRRLHTPSEVALLEQLLGNANVDESTLGQNLLRQAFNDSFTSTKRIKSSSTTSERQTEIELTSVLPHVKGDEIKARENATIAVLARHLLKADNVELIDRIGAGAFGEVRYY
jgi:hypothetical protein